MYRVLNQEDMSVQSTNTSSYKASIESALNSMEESGWALKHVLHDAPEMGRVDTAPLFIFHQL